MMNNLTMSKKLSSDLEAAAQLLPVQKSQMDAVRSIQALVVKLHPALRPKDTFDLGQATQLTQSYISRGFILVCGHPGLYDAIVDHKGNVSSAEELTTWATQASGAFYKTERTYEDLLPICAALLKE